MTPVREYLATLPGRCGSGFAPVQHPRYCVCREAPVTQKDVAYARFKLALVEAADLERLIHQTAMRPRIQSIPHKWRGQFYVKAKAEGVIEFAGKEPSTDAAGKNTDKDQKVWKMVAA